MEASGETISYRPVSRLAVAAAVFGVLSSLALTTPLLWILPLVGVAVAVVALADVARPGAEKAGRVAALAGLALSAGFGAQAVTSTLVAKAITERRAQAVVHAWLDALGEDRLPVARSMMAPNLLPQTHEDGHGPGEQGHHDHAGEAESIEALPVVAAIRRCGASVRDVRSAGRDEETSEQWVVRARLSPCADGGRVDVRLQLAPSVLKEPKGSVERWTITAIELAP